MIESVKPVQQVLLGDLTSAWFPVKQHSWQHQQELPPTNLSVLLPCHANLMQFLKSPFKNFGTLFITDALVQKIELMSTASNEMNAAPRGQRPHFLCPMSVTRLALVVHSGDHSPTLQLEIGLPPRCPQCGHLNRFNRIGNVGNVESHRRSEEPELLAFP